MPNSASGIFFVKIRAKSEQKSGQNKSVYKFVIILWLVYIQCVTLSSGKQPNISLKAHCIIKIWAKSQKSGRCLSEFPQMPGYPGAPKFILAIWAHCKRLHKAMLPILKIFQNLLFNSTPFLLSIGLSPQAASRFRLFAHMVMEVEPRCRG